MSGTTVLIASMAAPGFPDPFDFSSTSMHWQGALQQLSEKLLYSLAIIELVIVGFQALVFKDSIVEFIRTFASKILLFILIGFGITHFNQAMPTIIGWFSSVAQSVSGCSNGSTGAQCQSQALSNLQSACQAGKVYQCPPDLSMSGNSGTTLIQHFVLWGMIYMMAADASKLADNIPGMAIGWTWGIPFPPDPGNGDPGLSKAFLAGHKEFQIFCMALGVICFMSAITVYITYLLMVFELQVVLSMGVITLALHGTKWSAQFGQAMPKYMANLGAKFFAYYFVCAAASAILNDPANQFTAILGLIAGAVTPFGVLSVALAALSGPEALMTVVMSGLVFSIPQFASALVSGSSATGAAAVWGQFNNAMKQGASMRGQGLQGDKEKGSSGSGADKGGKGGGGAGSGGGSAAGSGGNNPALRVGGYTFG